MITKPTCQTIREKSQQQLRSNSCPYYRKRVHRSSKKPPLGERNNCKYTQACALLEAIKLNERKPLTDRCLAHISCYIARAWEECCQQKVKQIFCLIRKLLEAASMDATLPFDQALQQFCQSPLTTTTICPSTTLLVAMKYIERLNKRYRDVKGSPGCCHRMIIVAFNIAQKYIHDCLRLIIYTDSRHLPPPAPKKLIIAPLTPPTSPIKTTPHNTTLPVNIAEAVKTDEKTSRAEADRTNEIQADHPSTTNSFDTERAFKIVCLEKEFLYFLNYDLSVENPSSLVTWAHSFDDSLKTSSTCYNVDYTSAEEADDEMEEEEDS